MSFYLTVVLNLTWVGKFVVHFYHEILIVHDELHCRSTRVRHLVEIICPRV